MHTKSFHGVKHSLTKNEMVILKSIALGLDCDTIRLLVEISEYQYQTLCKNIFSKLQVGNSYAAVQYAFKNGLLNQKEYNSEKIKGITLEFATQNIERLESLTAGDHKRNLWEFYDLLLDFTTRLEASYDNNSWIIEK